MRVVVRPGGNVAGGGEAPVERRSPGSRLTARRIKLAAAAVEVQCVWADGDEKRDGAREVNGWRCISVERIKQALKRWCTRAYTCRPLDPQRMPNIENVI